MRSWKADKDHIKGKWQSFMQGEPPKVGQAGYIGCEKGNHTLLWNKISINGKDP